MAEEQQGQEKTEEPTPRKLEKAREEGQAARSRELNTVALVTFGALALIAAAPHMAEGLLSIARYYFSEAASMSKGMLANLGDSAMTAIGVFIPLGLVLFVAGVLSSVAVGGLVFAPKALAFKGNRIDPIKGFGRIFSAKSAMELAKSIAKFVLVSALAVAVLSVYMDSLLMLGALPVEVAIVDGLTYVGIAFLLVGCALILVAAIDIPFQIQQHRKQLKMTKQEVKEELKNSEGKPEVKAKVRALQQQISQRRMLDAVPEADVIITNPEHFSVALKYDNAVSAAPVVIAKGVDHMALKIREIGQAHDVPMVPAPPLARAVYFSTELDQEVPEALYIAVAQVLAYVYQLEQYQRGQLAEAPQLAGIELPDEFAEYADD